MQASVSCINSKICGLSFTHKGTVITLSEFQIFTSSVNGFSAPQP